MPVREYTPERYVASQPRHTLGLDALSADSTNFMIDPAEKKMVRRRGQTTPTNWDTVLNASWSGNKPRGRQIIGMRANQLTDKSQHPTALFTDDEPDPKRGEIVTLDSDQADWYSLGQEYGTTHYPQTAGYYGGTGAAGSGLTLNYRWCPLWVNATTGPRYHRGTSAANRLLMFGGGRHQLEVGEWHFYASDNTPAMWSKTWNFATGSGSNINRRRPWGHQVPLYHPTITAAGGSASTKSWRKDRIVYYSCAFIFDDGSIGPFTPISDSLATAGTNGTYGRYTIPSTFDFYEYLNLTNIPRGGKGTKGRAIARTAQIDSTEYRTTFPGIEDLRIVTLINNNTTTTFQDYQGDDLTLIATPDLVRLDHKWPRRGKYLVANDSRFLIGGSLKPNSAAIIIAPTGITTTRDISAYGNASGNYIDDPDSQRSDEYLASPGTRGFLIEVSSSAFRLLFDDGGAGPPVPSSYAMVSGGVYLTLQALLDLINGGSDVGDASKEWRAQLAPGVDGDISCRHLDITTNNCNVGDDVRTNGLSSVDDLIWVRSPADPAVIYFSKAYMDTLPTNEQEVEFTRGGPSDTPAAILNWSADKVTQRTPGDAFVGRFLGAAPLGKEFICFYERGIYRLGSTKPGIDDSDENMRLFPLRVGNVNVVSDSSIFWGDGYAGCMTYQGIFVTDGQTHGILPASRDVWNSEKTDPADNTRGFGEWKNEINRSLKATQAGGRTIADDESFLYAEVLSDQLWITYRKSATAANDRAIVLDASTNADAEGLAVFRLADGGTLGFGCPLTTTFGAMCEIADQSGGMVRYGIVENVAQGKIIKFDVGTTDDGAAVTATGYFATDFCDTLRLKEAEQIEVLYAKNGSGLSFVLARDQGTSPAVHGSDTFTTALATTGDDLYGRKVIDLGPEARTAAEVFEPRIADDGSGDPPQIWRVLIPYSVRDFAR